MHQPVSRLVDLTDPTLNRIDNMTVDEARRRLAGGLEGMREVRGSFALVASEGVKVRLARSLDRPMRYFLAKRHAGPALYVADRIDTLHAALAADGLDAQFHPSYTRMVPAHHVVDIALVGCPDPDPIYSRFFSPTRNALPASLDESAAGTWGDGAGDRFRLRHRGSIVPARAHRGRVLRRNDSGAVLL
jgi:asparagine synthase (glutamine-hydrolysing)